MLLDPGSRLLSQSANQVIPRLSDELSLHTSPETHAAVIELKTGVHTRVDGVVAELAGLRRRLADELAGMGLCVAAAGTHALRRRDETALSSAPRYRMLGGELRSLARRQPTMALHVHVGVPDPEAAMRLLNGLRRSVPALLALSANSPFLEGGDGGFDSMRTVVFDAFPRTGLPRAFHGYTDYVEALESTIRPGAVPGPNFFWWDVRAQPRFGTVEVRVMDAQSTLADVGALVALIQSLSRLELEEGPPPRTPSTELLAENRFLAARDGMTARMIDPTGGRMVPVRAMVDAMLVACHPHAVALACARELEYVRVLAASPGARRQRRLAAAHGLDSLVGRLVDVFLTPPPAKGAADVPLARILRVADAAQRCSLHTGPLPD